MRTAGILLATALTLASAAPAGAATLTVLTDFNSLRTIESSAPGTLGATVPITGLGAGETLTAIDFRPSDGRLYGVALTAAGSVQLYRIDDNTGAATPVGGAFTSPPGVGDTIFGLDIDFDPSSDRLRFLTSWSDQRDIDPDSGAATVLPPPVYPAGDANAGELPFVMGLAAFPNHPGAASATIFGYEAIFDDAVRFGSTSGELVTYNVNAGVTTSGERYGLDVAPDGSGFLFARSGATPATELSRLFSYDLTPGTKTEIGPIGDGSDVIADIATQPVSNAIGFSSVAATGTEGETVTIGVTRSNSIGTASVDVGAGGGSNAAPGDYSGLPQTVSFANGAATANIQVQLAEDPAAEQDEVLALALSNPRGGRGSLAAPNTASLTIRNRAGDGPPVVSRRCAGRRATIVGTAARDVLRGTRRSDVIVALGGKDVVKAGRGNDVICGGAGDDSLAGEAGNDRIIGEAGNDRANGGAGSDSVNGGAGNDRLAGAAGLDRLLGGAGKDRLVGGRGRDRLLGGPGRDLQKQ